MSERDETDKSLRAERSKTDEQLERRRAKIEGDADRVVEVARERAGDTLRAARDRADRDLTTAGADDAVRDELDVERAAEDGAVAQEHEIADEQLRQEREARRRALSALLRFERDATDEGLVVERARADADVATRDDFLAMASHDLRTMLGGIALSAELLALHAKTEPEGGQVTAKHAARIRRFAAGMNRLVGDLLDVVSLEAGKLHVTPRPHDAVQLVRDAVDSFHALYATKQVALIVDVPATPVRATFDEERILQVLGNLLSNALKFTPAGGRVVLALARTGPDVHFTVTDSGVGIPGGLHEAIFERFRQVDPKDRRGLGLGLYIAKSIIDAHRGRIWVESPAGGGSALHFTLPDADPAA
jgi:signal transduction histidine kinase